MTAYAVGHLRPAELNEQILIYMERIQPTLDAHGGRFLVHDARVEVVEGTWPGSLVMISFPDLAAARAWYASDDYQEILALRTDNIDGDVVLVDGVAEDYDILRTVGKLRTA